MITKQSKALGEGGEGEGGEGGGVTSISYTPLWWEQGPAWVLSLDWTGRPRPKVHTPHGPSRNRLRPISCVEQFEHGKDWSYNTYSNFYSDCHYTGENWRTSLTRLEAGWGPGSALTRGQLSYLLKLNLNHGTRLVLHHLLTNYCMWRDVPDIRWIAEEIATSITHLMLTAEF